MREISVQNFVVVFVVCPLLENTEKKPLGNSLCVHLPIRTIYSFVRSRKALRDFRRVSHICFTMRVAISCAF